MSLVFEKNNKIVHFYLNFLDEYVLPLFDRNYFLFVYGALKINLDLYYKILDIVILSCNEEISDIVCSPPLCTIVTLWRAASIRDRSMKRILAYYAELAESRDNRPF